MKDLAQRRHLLFTTLTACSWRETPGGPTRVVAGLRQYLGGSLGIGRIVVGMARQSYDLQLTRYGEEGWRATFYPAGPGALRHIGGRVGVGAGRWDEAADPQLDVVAYTAPPRERAHGRMRRGPAMEYVGTDALLRDGTTYTPRGVPRHAAEAAAPL